MAMFRIMQRGYAGGVECTGEIATGKSCIEALQNHAEKMGFKIYQFHNLKIEGYEKKRRCISVPMGWRFAVKL